MSSRFAKFICLLAAVQLLGGHWMALQSVAWMRMVVSFAVQEDSLTGAIEKAFDGEHPCGLCKVVQRGQEEERKQEMEKIVVKLDAVLAPAVQLPLPRERVVAFEMVLDRGSTRDLAPPTPPPLA